MAFWKALHAARQRNFTDWIIDTNYVPVIGPVLSETFGLSKTRKTESILKKIQFVLLFFSGIIFILAGLLMIVAVIWCVIDGTSEESIATDTTILVLLGIIPCALGVLLFWRALVARKGVKVLRIELLNKENQFGIESTSRGSFSPAPTPRTSTMLNVYLENY
ncbi:MAG: hypothetical protein GY854_34655 [Deltaproteobacteria bacterium]|nr:hypothetical protein [Deltaproteobacteria bacterium]